MGVFRLSNTNLFKTICFSCGTYGHVQENFPKLNPNVDSAPPAAAPSTNTPHPTGNEAFGPCWFVERCQRRSPRKPSELSSINSVSILRSPVINNLMDPNPKPVKSSKQSLFGNPSLFPTVLRECERPVTPGSSQQSHRIHMPAINLDIAKHTTIILLENDDPHILWDHLAIASSTSSTNVLPPSDPPILTTMKPGYSKMLRPWRLMHLMGLKRPLIHAPSGSRATHVIATLGFPNSFRVEAAGFSGGLWLYWYNTVDIEVLVTHFQFIHCHMRCKSDNALFEATLVEVGNIMMTIREWSGIVGFPPRISLPH
ncbi:hypothetical protein V6N13_093166 [Hibiscus sabdariffa]